jgi:hypothetical protein
MKNFNFKNMLASIEEGDLLHYCPADLNKKHHEYGIIYNIIEYNNSTYYKVYWQKTKIHNCFSELSIEKKLTKKINNQNIMLLIKNE